MRIARALMAAALAVAVGMAYAEPLESRDIAGNAVRVPGAAGARAGVLLFVRPGQPQSRMAIQQMSRSAGGVDGALVVSGDAQAAGGMGAPEGWRVVADPQMEISGAYNVHAWPTAVVLRPDGSEQAHLPGLTPGLAADVSAHAARAAGQIDEAALKQRLENRQVIDDAPASKARRHAELAERMMGRGEFSKALAELDLAAGLSPEEPRLRGLIVRALIGSGDAPTALTMLDGLPAGLIPLGEAMTLRGRALLSAGRVDEAKAALEKAVSVSPDAGEALYLLGMVLERQGDVAGAAAAYRRAFESAAPAGQRVPAEPVSR